MAIFALGINHKTATIAVREKVFFPFEKLGLYLQDLLTCGFTEEAVLLSTCNRSELYCVTHDVNALYEWFSAQTTLSDEILHDVIYLHEGEAAVRHIMEVACGLDSMILGEPQILGQMKDAFSESCAASAVGPLFHRLFQEVFKVSKEIRTATAVGACPVSVASAAVHFAKSQIKHFSHVSIVMLGAGETADLLLRYFQAEQTKTVTILNRSLSQAIRLAKTFNVEARPIQDLVDALKKADLVFSATGSINPIVTKQLLTPIMAERHHHPITFIDLAVPRDIDSAVIDIDQVNLYCIDDLKTIIEMNRQGREHAASKAREMIRQASEDFMQEIHSHEHITHTIRAYRGQIESICRTELVKAKRQLHQGANAEEVLEIFARSFTQKLLHAPSVQLRAAGAKGHFELLRFAKELFALPDVEDARL
ncbi:MAG: glutamyl-tRNA reductase [Gammaproteobacteria bacterium]|nr:glutamyl-tRNA reductase [Gammaproteobacteria bacterium]